VQFSSTNVIEQGVDEADLLKFDGTDLYLIQSYANYYPVAVMDAGSTAGVAASMLPPIADPADGGIQLRVLRPDAAGTAAPELARYTLPADYFSPSNVEGMYFHQKDAVKQLSIVAERYAYDRRPGLDYWGWCGMWSEGKTDVYLLDVSNPAAIAPQVQLEIDGYLVQSRRIDNTLYLVTRYTPSTPVSNVLVPPPVEDGPGPVARANTQNNTNTKKIADVGIMPPETSPGSEKEEIDAAIDALSLDDLLPKISINGVSHPLLEPSGCFVDEGEPGYPTLMVITAINLDNPEQISSSCVTANTDGMYMAPKALYLYQSKWDMDKTSTEIYKFALTETGSVYSASGTVEGSPSVQHFSLSEDKDILRVITSSGAWNASTHQIFTLEDKAGELSVLAKLPNDAHPEIIGKPGEMIQSVRFVGSKAYVVTFLQKDPLYVIDLADPLQPFIAGQVEIPGFSTILQPVGENALLGFGFEDSQFKLELYDVSSPQQPVSVAKTLLPGSSDAVWNYKAISLLSDENTGLVRVAVPYSEWSDTGSLFGAQMFTVDVASQQLQDAGLMSVSDATQEYFYPYSPRILLLNNAVHYASGIDVWSGVFGVAADGVKQ
jgi:hypothetical protein